MTAPFDLPFPVQEYAARLARVQREMHGRGIRVLMINHLENIYYLTGYRTIGFYSFMALFVPGNGNPVHLVRLIEKSALQGSSWVEDAVYAWFARHRAVVARFWGDPPELTARGDGGGPR